MFLFVGWLAFLGEEVEEGSINKGAEGSSQGAIPRKINIPLMLHDHGAHRFICFYIFAVTV